MKTGLQKTLALASSFALLSNIEFGPENERFRRELDEANAGLNLPIRELSMPDLSLMDMSEAEGLNFTLNEQELFHSSLHPEPELFTGREGISDHGSPIILDEDFIDLLKLQREIEDEQLKKLEVEILDTIGELLGLPKKLSEYSDQELEELLKSLEKDMQQMEEEEDRRSNGLLLV